MRETIYDTIRRLVSMLREEDVDEIEVRRWWTAVRVARRRPREAAESAGAAVNETVPSRRRDETALRAPSGGAEEGAADHGIGAAPAGPTSHAGAERPAIVVTEIISPMVGTFYRAPAPGADPFVNEGDRVEVGEVLCIIEAMKLMNEIEADRGGIIKKVLAKDRQPVEYGQPLFLVESA